MSRKNKADYGTISLKKKTIKKLKTYKNKKTESMEKIIKDLINERERIKKLLEKEKNKSIRYNMERAIGDLNFMINKKQEVKK